jgi:hypothetical protein
MPAYSEFLGTTGLQLYRACGGHIGSAIFVAGSNTVLIDAGINVLHEFAPDVKRRLHLAHRHLS